MCEELLGGKGAAYRVRMASVRSTRRLWRLYKWRYNNKETLAVQRTWLQPRHMEGAFRGTLYVCRLCGWDRWYYWYRWLWQHVAWAVGHASQLASSTSDCPAFAQEAELRSITSRLPCRHRLVLHLSSWAALFGGCAVHRTERSIAIILIAHSFWLACVVGRAVGDMLLALFVRSSVCGLGTVGPNASHSRHGTNAFNNVYVRNCITGRCCMDGRAPV